MFTTLSTRYAKNSINKNRLAFLARFNQQKYLLLLVIPGIIWFLIFNYLPMAGIVMAFQNYEPGKGLLNSSFAGLKYFRQFFNDYHFKIILSNTLGISFLKLLFGFPAPIILALLLNELSGIRLKKLFQTVSYLPYFVSWVIVIGIVKRILSPDGGLVNTILISMGANDPINFMLKSEYMWPLAVLTEIWKSIGWNSIIYLAAITTINTELYESSKMDGAGKWSQLWHVTIPGIKPTMAILFIFAVGAIFTANFDQLYLMGTEPVLDKTEVVDTYVYRIGLKNIQFSLGAAVGLLKSVISLAMVIITNYFVKLMGEEGLW